MWLRCWSRLHYNKLVSAWHEEFLMSSIIGQIMFNVVDQWWFSYEYFCSKLHKFYSQRIFLIDLAYLHSSQLLRITELTMGLLLKLHLSSYITRNTQDLGVTANVIVLFLLWVMKDATLICLLTTLPQFMWMASVSTGRLDLFTFLDTQASFVN